MQNKPLQLKIKLPNGGFALLQQKKIIGFPKKRHLNYEEPFVEWKSSMDVKGSTRNCRWCQ